MKRILSAFGRRFAQFVMKALPIEWRVRVLEKIANETVTTQRISGGSIQFDSHTPLLLSRAMSVLSKEGDMIQWIDGFSEGAVLWDIGANVGVFSLYAAIKKKVRVLSFEPSNSNFHILCRNIQLNNLSNRVAAYCLAFAGHTELGVLNQSAPELGGALSHFGNVGEVSRYAESISATQGMIGFTVDDFVDIFHPPLPSHIKIDVDGLENSILSGARKTLENPQVRSLMVELSVSREQEREEAIGLLDRAGWKLVSQGEPQSVKEESAANHLFRRAN